MCSVSLTEFDSLDILDSEAVLTASRIIQSEKRSENLHQRALVAALNKHSAAAVNRTIKAEKNYRDSLNGGTERINTPAGKVIIH